MDSAVDFFRNSYATGGGAITPWGTIRILDASVPNLENVGEDRLGSRPGLAVWSQELIRYGKPEYRAKVARDTVQVKKCGELIEEIPFSEFFVPGEEEHYVHEDGYLEFALGHDNSCTWNRGYGLALRRAEAGERPNILDNSTFIKVSTALAGQKLVVLDFSEDLRMNQVLVFTKSGKLVPYRCHAPLAYAKWQESSNSPVWFEKCNCGASAAHGHFFADGRGKCPVATYSLETGETMLELLADEFGLSCLEKAKVRCQLLTAGLAEQVTLTELAAIAEAIGVGMGLTAIVG
jgi:hypothetical protein